MAEPWEEAAGRPPRIGRMGWGRGVALCVVAVLFQAGGVYAGCFEATSKHTQGMCLDEYKIKVCASSQEAAQSYIDASHGVIVKANCKKALGILCGDIGGGEPTNDLESVCCNVANQCEKDEECGTVVNPADVPMCCEFCEGTYNDACEASQPVNAGFSSIVQLYDTFHASQVMHKCSGQQGQGGIQQCVQERGPGMPCLKEPAEQAEEARRRKAERQKRRQAQAMAMSRRQMGSGDSKSFASRAASPSGLLSLALAAAAALVAGRRFSS